MTQEKKYQEVKGGDENKQLGVGRAAYFSGDVGIMKWLWNHGKILPSAYGISNAAMVDLPVLQTDICRHQKDLYEWPQITTIVLHFLCKWLDPQLLELHKIV